MASSLKTFRALRYYGEGGDDEPLRKGKDIELRFLTAADPPPPRRPLPGTAPINGLRRMEPSPTAVVYLRDAAVLAPDCQVMTSDNALLRESVVRRAVIDQLPTQRPQLEADLMAAPEAQSVGDRWAALVGSPRAENYFHWWLDCLPRPWVADRWESTRNCPLLVPPLTRPFQAESLALLGWEGRVRELERPVERYPRLLFASALDFGAAQAVSPLLAEFASFCRGKLGLSEEQGVGGTGPRRRRWNRARGIYISRAIAPRRRIVNEPELIDALNSIGIESIQLESLSVEEQAVLFSGANLVVGVHGAGLTNVIFCAPDTPLIEILPEAPSVVSAYGAMATILSLRYGYLVAAPADLRPEAKPADSNSDLVVDPDEVLRAVRAALG